MAGDSPSLQPDDQARQPLLNLLIVTCHHDRSSGTGLGGDQLLDDFGARLIDACEGLVQQENVRLSKSSSTT
jgi:hypothetical protein